MTRSYRPGRTDGAASFRGQQAGQLGELGLEVPARAGQVLIAAAGRRRQGPHRLEPAGRIDGHGCDLGMQPDPLLERRSPPVGVELALPDLQQGGVHMVDAAVRQQR